MMVQAEPRSTAPLHYVRSVGEFAAPPAVVWRHVVAFPALPPATEWVFRVGVAAPLAARIRGSGVGALRFCDFTTGSFVDPITAWDENRLLAFDSVRQALPIRVRCAYRYANPPHL